MDKRQESIIKMAWSVSGIFNAYQTIVDKTPGLPAAQDRLEDLIDDSEHHSQGQLNTGTEFTEQKNAAKHTLTGSLITICAALAALGTTSADPAVQVFKTKYTMPDSDITTKRDLPLFAFAYMVYNDALLHVDKLTPFATKADVDGLKILADNYNALLPKRRSQQNKSVLSTKNLEETIAAIMALRDDPIGILVKALHASEPDFYNAVTHAKHIDGRSTGKKKKGNGGTTGTAGK